MVKAWTCYLMQSSPRYQAWRAILGTDEVPIINPIPFAATLGDEEGIEVHKLDIDKLNLAQQSLLIDFCLRKFGSNITGDQRAQVERELNEVGFPIRADNGLKYWLAMDVVQVDVTVTTTTTKEYEATQSKDAKGELVLKTSTKVTSDGTIGSRTIAVSLL